ncbi:hypothetical protein WJX73_002233 [Symbiochloris irregularis]|uniref:Pantoate--beta-alanine ligase n=1 Tax=Symbiochloris irregularis TaxID=706552 RepID=A0AAW1PV78_9CHLO
MLICSDADEMRSFSRTEKKRNRTVALVPTMGCLHDGHASLIKAARTEADVVVVSIYVNPTQFSVNEDFGQYPRQRAADHTVLEALGVEATFEPASLYHRGSQGAGEAASLAGADSGQPGSHETFVQVERLQKGLCARTRPHFFKGVATVVLKLFHIVEPDVAFFGQKDYQQLQVITRMTRDLDMAVRVASVPIMREPDGLAMSSRNKLLSPEARKASLSIWQALQWAQEACASGSVAGTAALQAEVAARIGKAGGKVDYVEVVDPQELTTLTNAGEAPAVITVLAIERMAEDRLHAMNEEQLGKASESTNEGRAPGTLSLKGARRRYSRELLLSFQDQPSQKEVPSSLDSVEFRELQRDPPVEHLQGPQQGRGLPHSPPAGGIVPPKENWRNLQVPIRPPGLPPGRQPPVGARSSLIEESPQHDGPHGQLGASPGHPAQLGGQPPNSWRRPSGSWRREDGSLSPPRGGRQGSREGERWSNDAWRAPMPGGRGAVPTVGGRGRGPAGPEGPMGRGRPGPPPMAQMRWEEGPAPSLSGSFDALGPQGRPRPGGRGQGAPSGLLPTRESDWRAKGSNGAPPNGDARRHERDAAGRGMPAWMAGDEGEEADGRYPGKAGPDGGEADFMRMRREIEAERAQFNRQAGPGQAHPSQAADFLTDDDYEAMRQEDHSEGPTRTADGSASQSTEPSPIREPASHPPPGLGNVPAMHSTATRDLRAAFGFDDDSASDHSQEREQRPDSSPAAAPKPAAPPMGPAGSGAVSEGFEGMDEGMHRRFHWLQLEASPTRPVPPSAPPVSNGMGALMEMMQRASQGQSAASPPPQALSNAPAGPQAASPQQQPQQPRPANSGAPGFTRSPSPARQSSAPSLAPIGSAAEGSQSGSGLQLKALRSEQLDGHLPGQRQDSGGQRDSPPLSAWRPEAAAQPPSRPASALAAPQGAQAQAQQGTVAPAPSIASAPSNPLSTWPSFDAKAPPREIRSLWDSLSDNTVSLEGRAATPAGVQQQQQQQQAQAQHSILDALKRAQTPQQQQQQQQQQAGLAAQRSGKLEGVSTGMPGAKSGGLESMGSGSLRGQPQGAPSAAANQGAGASLLSILSGNMQPAAGAMQPSQGNNWPGSADAKESLRETLDNVFAAAAKQDRSVPAHHLNQLGLYSQAMNQNQLLGKQSMPMRHDGVQSPHLGQPSQLSLQQIQQLQLQQQLQQRQQQQAALQRLQAGHAGGGRLSAQLGAADASHLGLGGYQAPGQGAQDQLQALLQRAAYSQSAYGQAQPQSQHGLPAGWSHNIDEATLASLRSHGATSLEAAAKHLAEQRAAQQALQLQQAQQQQLAAQQAAAQSRLQGLAAQHQAALQQQQQQQQHQQHQQQQVPGLSMHMQDQYAGLGLRGGLLPQGLVSAHSGLPQGHQGQALEGLTGVDPQLLAQAGRNAQLPMLPLQSRHGHRQ